jgi:protein required for attachment to host cells
MSIWILVSDASRAVLYATEKRGDDWQVIGSYQHPESRLKNSELTSSEPGHAAKSKGGARHTVMQPDTTPKEAEFGHFAQQLADVLAAGTKHRSFEGLVLVAPPHFLGLLRQHLSTEGRKRLITSIDQDYTSLDSREVRRRLEGAVFGPATP